MGTWAFPVRLSGWQRIGIILSVLWLICSPTGLSVVQNKITDSIEKQCDITHDGSHDAHIYCFFQAHPLDEPANLWRDHSALLWTVLLGPFALIWIGGAVVIGVARWVARGFRPQEISLTAVGRP